jgi:Tfp pilus assembly protein PilX
MLKPNAPPSAPRGQRGVVLLLSLIVLAAMSLAAVGLTRSVLTSNRVAGNLAFQQSALQSADRGLETAIAWLEQQARAVDSKQVKTNPLSQSIKADEEHQISTSYIARRENPGKDQNWDTYWTKTLLANGQVNTLPVDAAGNTVSFVIHRLCNAAGANSACEVNRMVATGDDGAKDNSIQIQPPGLPYYRITVRVQGPRNAVSFVQAVVAI